MLPLRDIIPTRTAPWVSLSIAASLLVVFLVERFSSAETLRAFFWTAGVVPSFASWPTMISAVFLHAGWLQMVSNVACLALFGEAVEDRLGHGRFLLLFYLAGSVGNLVHVVIAPHSFTPMVGSGGAVAGVLAGHLTLFPHSRVLTWIPVPGAARVDEVPAGYFLVGWLAVQLLGAGELSVMTLAGALGTSPWALLGGFTAGLVATLALRRRDREAVDWWHP